MNSYIYGPVYQQAAALFVALIGLTRAENPEPGFINISISMPVMM